MADATQKKIVLPILIWTVSSELLNYRFSRASTGAWKRGSGHGCDLGAGELAFELPFWEGNNTQLDEQLTTDRDFTGYRLD